MLLRAFLFSLLTSWPVLALAQSTARLLGVAESDLKAVFIVRLLDFIQSDLQPTTSVICVVGESETGSALHRLVASRTDKPLSIRSIKSAEGIAQCNLLFLAGGSESLPTENATNMNVLTVSDMPDFAYNGGMVELTRTQNRVALTVNTGATAAASIQLSSRLLALATVISPEDSTRHEN